MYMDLCSSPTCVQDTNMHHRPASSHEHHMMAQIEVFDFVGTSVSAVDRGFFSCEETSAPSRRGEGGRTLNARFCAALAGLRVLPAMLRAFALRTVLLGAGPGRPRIVSVLASHAMEFTIAILFSGSGDGSSSGMQDRHAQDSSTPPRSGPRHPVIQVKNVSLIDPLPWVSH